MDLFAVGEPCLQRQKTITGSNPPQYKTIEYPTHEAMVEALKNKEVCHVWIC